MIRNVVGSVLALVGAAAAVWSPFRAWYDGRHGRDYALGDLFTGITADKADLFTSILLPFLVAALLTLVGVVLRSRALVAVAGVLVLGFTILWMVRVGQAEGSLTVGGDAAGLGDGVANALGGGVLLLLGALVMSGRGRAPRVDGERGPAHPAPYDDRPPPEHPGDDPHRHPQDPYAPTQTYDVPTWRPDGRDEPPRHQR
ncbi:hypothetical protein ACFUAG_18015 [Streptomyces sp. NPDC057193]|uniref:hypothetical protein n=1 Tax=Streptomyces sp. NPDC057193 TaxID=3346043 RepID=UPI0036425781